jgi:hypothetical protein
MAREVLKRHRRTRGSLRLVHDHLARRVAELRAEENNLLDLIEDGGGIAAKVRLRLTATVELRGLEP